MHCTYNYVQEHPMCDIRGSYRLISNLVLHMATITQQVGMHTYTGYIHSRMF